MWTPFYSTTAWDDYSPEWCTPKGHKRLSLHVPLSEDCKKLCIERNPNCKAIEWWENRGGLCYECTNTSMRTHFDDLTDLAYPPHVFIMQQAQGKPVDKPAQCNNENPWRP